MFHCISPVKNWQLAQCQLAPDSHDPGKDKQLWKMNEWMFLYVQQLVANFVHLTFGAGQVAYCKLIFQRNTGNQNRKLKNELKDIEMIHRAEGILIMATDVNIHRSHL